MIDLRNVPTTELLAELARRDETLEALTDQLRGMRQWRLLQEAGYTFTPATYYIATRYIVPETTG